MVLDIGTHWPYNSFSKFNHPDPDPDLDLDLDAEMATLHSSQTFNSEKFARAQRLNVTVRRLP